MFPVAIENDMAVITSENGQVRHLGVVQTLSSLADNPARYQNKKLLIIDPGSDYNPSKEELQQFSDFLSSLLVNVFPRIALVAPRILHYGLGKMVEVFSESEEGQFRVFRDEQEARAWLCIGPTESR